VAGTRNRNGRGEHVYEVMGVQGKGKGSACSNAIVSFIFLIPFWDEKLL